MASPTGLRERKKQRIRQAVAVAATRRFAEHGFDATSVAAICSEADVAVSTFYVYFDAKEAAAFPDAEARAELVVRALEERPVGEPLHQTLRRASHAVAEQDLLHADEVAARLRLLAREPKLAAYAAKLQSGYAERFAVLLAHQMGVQPDTDPRPRLVMSAIFGALDAAWSSWTRDDPTDLHALVDQVHDTLDVGFAQALRNRRGR